MTGQVAVVPAQDAEAWQDVLDRVGRHDFYDLAAYRRLAEPSGEGRAWLFAYREGDCTLAFSLLVREVDLPGLPREGWGDLTSIYGYGDPKVSAEEGRRA